MKNLSFSFNKKSKLYFVFDIDTGKTIKTKYPLRRLKDARMAWLSLRGK
jgi:hypothetical protein